MFSFSFEVVDRDDQPLFFRNSAIRDGELTMHSEMQRKTSFPLHFSRFFVTLQEIAIFLYVKAVWGIEKFPGYELETVLNSTFYYKLLSMSTR